MLRKVVFVAAGRDRERALARTAEEMVNIIT